LSFVDAHTHLAEQGYAGKIGEILEDAKTNEVSCVLSNATDYQTSLETIALAKRYQGTILAAVGAHPSVATKDGDPDIEKFPALVDENRNWIKAIGEIGLDGKYATNDRVRTRQREIFRFFLSLAEERRLPVVVHSRQAVPEVLETLADYRLPRVLLHWYDGPIENIPAFKKLGYLISTGPVLFYSPRIEEVARAAELNMLLTETDGPVTYRGPFAGQLTKPSFVIQVVHKLAKLKGAGSIETRDAVFANFQHFLNT